MRLERSEQLRNEALYKAAVIADQVRPLFCCFWARDHLVCGSMQHWTTLLRVPAVCVSLCIAHTAQELQGSSVSEAKRVANLTELMPAEHQTKCLCNAARDQITHLQLDCGEAYPSANLPDCNCQVIAQGQGLRTAMLLRQIDKALE